VGARTSRGGGPNLFAPWPAGQTLIAGGRCGNYRKEGAHDDYHGRWTDDRYAVDFGVCGDADLGMDVLAAHEGTVQVAKRDASYGLTVVVERAPNADASRYAHLDSIQPGVRPGVRVAPGQRLGTIGHSGAGGGPSNAHLHFARYRSRAPSDGMKIVSMAGVDLCDGCRIESLTQYATPGAPPFVGSLVDISEEFIEEAWGGLFPQVIVEIKFNQPFDRDHFVLRPRTEQTRRFTSPDDVRGVRRPAKRNAGVYYIQIGPGDLTTPNEYGLRWDLVNTLTGQTGGLLVKVRMRVVSPPHRDNPCPPARSDATGNRTPSNNFKATLESQFPMDAQGTIRAYRGSEIEFGFNIRFNKPFEPNFVLRPRTVESINWFVRQFGSVGADFPGAVPTNDDHVGYYREVLSVPGCVPDGTYPLSWLVLDKNTDEFGGLEPGFNLAVVSRPPGAPPSN
jgi:murein DD-endopeptidase MepM/ murein hydrolase activator NlpD